MRSFLLILILIVLFSCRQDNRSIHLTSKVISRDNIELEKLISDVQYIPILEDDGYYMTLVQSVIERDNKIYFRCRDQQAIFIFNTSGNFIRKIVASGTGPEEFSSVNKIGFSENDSTILILDADKRKICEINEYSEEVLRCLHFKDVNINAFFYHNNALYTLTNGNPTGFLKVYQYSDFSLLNESIFSPRFFNAMPSPRPFTSIDDDVYVAASLTDTIYRVHDHTENYPYAVLNPGLPPLYSIEGNIAGLFFTHQLTNKYPDYSISQGMISSYGSYLFVSDINRRIQLVIHPDSRDILELKVEDATYYNLFNSGYFLNMMHVDDNYATSVIYLTDKFYSDAQKYIANHNNVVGAAISDLIDKYPPEAAFNNPAVVKFALDKEYLELLFQN